MSLAALGSSEMGLKFYLARGWQLWSGTASVMTPHGIERTADDEDSIYILPVGASLNFGRDLTCDWRDGDVW